MLDETQEKTSFEHDETTTALKDSQQEDIHKSLIDCQREVESWKNKYLHVLSDFQNFKRRSEKERMNLIEMAQLSVIKEQLGLLDDVERAIETLENQKEKSKSADIDSLLAALTMVHASFVKMLAKFNVTAMKENQTFDPELHEAVSMVASPDHQSGAIVAVLQKGYRMGDSVIRHAKVSVAE